MSDTSHDAPRGQAPSALALIGVKVVRGRRRQRWLEREEPLLVKPALAWSMAAAVLAVLATATVGLAQRPQAFAHTSLHLSPRTVSMPGFGREALLGPSEVEDLTEYVLALSTRS